MRDTYEKMKSLVLETEEDLQKAESGNKAAGTRVRKAMQEVRTLAQDLRKQVLEAREEG